MENFATWLEAMMMICFGLSWPAALIKTIRTKNPAGKSLIFLVLVFIGYLAGLASRIIAFKWVFFLYLINAMLVGSDLLFTIYYLRRNKRMKALEKV